MHNYPKPRIVVSACLQFRACRYNGVVIPVPFIEKMKDHVHFMTLCPEADIGMGIPRKPVRLVQDGEHIRLLQPASAVDWTEKMQSYIKSQRDTWGEVDGFLLKAKSPSCGIKGVKIYKDAQGNRPASRGTGLFAQRVKEWFPLHPIEEEGRLFNFSLREQFLTQIFTLARFREVKTIGDLIQFQSRHKLLFLGYNQAAMRRMGSLLSGYNKENYHDIYTMYQEELFKLFQAPIKPNSMINVLTHGLGGFKKVLTVEEKAYFLELLEDYRDERIPLSVPMGLLKAWSIQHHNQYLLDQYILQPYPKELIEITDSGKGRNLK